MGTSSSSEINWENPSPNHDATLYYFSGRGLADQARWLMAATNVKFTQRVISHRDDFVRMSKRQLPFGQLPLLQIDGFEIVQSQAMVRYLAKRGGIDGKNVEENLKCDMIAATVADLLPLVCNVPFLRVKTEAADKEKLDKHLETMREKWAFIGGRFEAILTANFHFYYGKHANPQQEVALFLVGDSLTYVDILVTHMMTWFIEECGPSIANQMPRLIELQNRIISLPTIREFIQSINYFPIGDIAYVEQVRNNL